MKKMKMMRENSLSFEQGCELYLNNCRERNLRQGTINHYRQSYVQFYKFFDIIMTRFNDDNIEAEFVTLDICGFESENGTELEIYLLDATYDLKLIQRSVFYGNKFTWKPKVANYDCYLLKLKRK